MLTTYPLLSRNPAFGVPVRPHHQNSRRCYPMKQYRGLVRLDFPRSTTQPATAMDSYRNFIRLIRLIGDSLNESHIEVFALLHSKPPPRPPLFIPQTLTSLPTSFSSFHLATTALDHLHTVQLIAQGFSERSIVRSAISFLSFPQS